MQKHPSFGSRAGISVAVLASAAVVLLAAYGAPPTIDYPPRGQEVILYQQAAFGVIAGGTPPLAYQWLKNGIPIPGATNDQIVIRQTQFSDEGLYSVVVSNAEGSVSSAEVGLHVRLPTVGDLDFSFVHAGQVGTQVRAMAVQPDGRIFIVGPSEGTGDAALRGVIIRLHRDGTPDHTFRNEEFDANGTIFSIALQKDGKLLIGGNFTRVNGRVHNRLARLNRDGTTDLTFMNELSGVLYKNSAAGSVYCLALQTDGKILLGGEFDEIHGLSRRSIARLNPDGTLDTSFEANAPGRVYSLVLLSDDRLLVGGTFTSINGISQKNIARLNSNGALDASFSPVEFGPQGLFDGVTSLAVQNDGKIIIGGYFVAGPDGSFTNLARLEANGGLDESLRHNNLTFGSFTVPSPISAINVQSNGKILIGGYFVSASGENVARLNSDGSLDDTFQAAIGASVTSMLIENDGKILVGGSINTLNGITRHGIARLNDDGSLNGSLAEPPLPLVNGAVDAFAVQNDGTIILGGAFTTIAGTPRKYLTRLNSNGSLEETFSTHVDAAVRRIVLQDDEKIFIAGNFSTVNGVSRQRIARVNPDGTLDETFQAGLPGVIGVSVDAIAVQSDGKLLIGGQFNAVNGVARNNLARLNADGSLDLTFPGLGSSGWVPYSIVVQSDGKVLVGGFSGILRFDADGWGDDGFHRIHASRLVRDRDFYRWTSASIWSVVPSEEGKLLICGNFDRIDGEDRRGFARLNANGTLDMEFAPGTSGQRVSSVLLEADGGILVAGLFSAPGHVGYVGIARLNQDGTLNRVLLKEPSSAVNQIAAQGNDFFLISGGFSKINKVPMPYFARVWATDFPPFPIAPTVCNTKAIYLPKHGSICLVTFRPRGTRPAKRTRTLRLATVSIACCACRDGTLRKRGGI
jgi:uncharacterized delta-60 repeat protein